MRPPPPDRRPEVPPEARVLMGADGGTRMLGRDGDAPAPPTGAQAARPGPRPSEAEAAALAVLRLESEVRSLTKVRDLFLLIANETPRFTRARQVMVIALDEPSRPATLAVTSHPSVERRAPLIQAIERLLAHALSRGAAGPRELGPADIEQVGEPSLSTYPFQHLLWLPLPARDGSTRGGVLLARETPWIEGDKRLALHLAGAYAYAWDALERTAAPPIGQRIARVMRRRRVAVAACMVAIAAGAVPVPMTALAPLEVGPRAPFVVAAPLDGVIDDIVVLPNARVKQGDMLARLVDTTLKGRLEVAEREVQVAEARLRKLRQLAFDDPRGRHEQAVAAAELEAKVAERDAARDMLARAVVRANRDGVVLFADRRDLIGRPVAVGERLMEIADPGDLELRADLAIADAIVLAEGARLRGYLDADPLRPIEARVTRFDYQARALPSGALAFRVTAEPAGGDAEPLRLGARGTAQIHSSPVPLAFYLFRRPLAALRQWIGL